MWTTRNIALVVGSAAVIAPIAFLGGRHVESEAATGGGATAALPVLGSSRSLPAEPATSPDLPASLPLGSPTGASDLLTRLQAERDSRLKLEPTADSVFAAMGRSGVEVDEQLQVAGFVVGARYCDKVRTKSDVHVVVCEFADEGSAIKGVAFGQNDAIKNREVLRNKTSTCAIHQADPKHGSADATRIKGLFVSM